MTTVWVVVHIARVAHPNVGTPDAMVFAKDREADARAFAKTLPPPVWITEEPVNDGTGLVEAAEAVFGTTTAPPATREEATMLLNGQLEKLHTPKVLNKRQWPLAGYARLRMEYVGRPTKWGNPFVIGKDGTRKEVMAKYRDWITDQPALLDSLHELTGKDLVCWCAPEECHADVLLQLANVDTIPTNEDLWFDLEHALSPASRTQLAIAARAKLSEDER